MDVTKERAKRSEYAARRAANRRKFKIKRIIKSVIGFILVTVFTLTASAITVKVYDKKHKKTLPVAEYVASETKNNTAAVEVLGNAEVPSYVSQEFLKIGNARSGIKLDAVNNIVIHYVGNAGTTAEQNWHYFADPETEVCSHFIVGLGGEVIQCIPLDERSAASNWRNVDTVSIEVCHDDDSGQFNAVTYASVVKLTAWLCNEAGLQSSDIIRHFDITGKECPKYYVNNPSEWEEFKNSVAEEMNNYGE